MARRPVGLRVANRLLRCGIFQSRPQRNRDCQGAPRAPGADFGANTLRLASMPAETMIEKRNRALLAFTLLSGARDRAIVSMKLRHVDLIEGRVYQDARQVRTKFAKTFWTPFIRSAPTFEICRRVDRAPETS